MLGRVVGASSQVGPLRRLHPVRLHRAASDVTPACATSFVVAKPYHGAAPEIVAREQRSASPPCRRSRRGSRTGGAPSGTMPANRAANLGDDDRVSPRTEAGAAGSWPSVPAPSAWVLPSVEGGQSGWLYSSSPACHCEMLAGSGHEPAVCSPRYADCGGGREGRAGRPAVVQNPATIGRRERSNSRRSHDGARPGLARLGRRPARDRRG